MKKLVFILLFIPLISFSQDFRKMSFGQSTEELKETYPQYEFTVENEMGTTILSHNDIVGGVETTVAYLFVDNSLASGFYYFDRTNIFKADEDRYKDYKNISEFLNGKYEMKETNTWHDDGYKDEPNRYSHAFTMGQVDFSESYSNDNVLINHTLVKADGVNTHILGYISPSLAEFISEKNDSDF